MKIENLAVVQSNALIESRKSGTKSLTLVQKRFLLYIISLTKKGDDDLAYYDLDVSTVASIIGSRGGNQTLTTLAAIDDLDSDQHAIKITEKDTSGKVKRIIKTRWILESITSVGSGKIRVLLSPTLKPYLLELRKRFTIINLHYALTLRSTNQVRLYELLKSKQAMVKWSVKYDDLKQMMGLKDSYAKYGYFSSHVLKKSQDQFKKTTDISFNFSEIRGKKRSVESIIFVIRSNEKLNKNVVPLENKNLLDKLSAISINTRISQGLIDKHGAKVVSTALDDVTKNYQGANPSGVLITKLSTLTETNLAVSRMIDSKQKKDNVITKNRDYFTRHKITKNSKVVVTDQKTYISISNLAGASGKSILYDDPDFAKKLDKYLDK